MPHERIIPVVDQPIALVAALLHLSRYFIGVDNGIKHLARALDKPHSLIAPSPPDLSRPEACLLVPHWVPDFHRMLVLS